MHRLHAGAVLIADAWPRRIEMDALLVVAATPLQIARQGRQLAGAQAKQRNDDAVEVGAASVIGTSSHSCFPGLNGDAHFLVQASQFFFCHGNSSPGPRISAGLNCRGGGLRVHEWDEVFELAIHAAGVTKCLPLGVVRSAVVKVRHDFARAVLAQVAIAGVSLADGARAG